MKTVFRPLDPSEDLASHAVLLEAFDWLRSRNIRQWLVPLPFEVFQKRTRDRRNHGYFEGTDLLAVVAISKLLDEHWIDVLGMEPRWWLSALAVRTSAHGRGLGKRVVGLSLAEVAKSGAKELFLDCVDGALPRYYGLLGFECRHTKIVTYPSGNSFSMVLLRAPVPNQAPEPTTPGVTPAADAPVAPPGVVAHL